MVREKNDNIEDGAAETMLGNNEKEQLAEKKEEVKFIPADHKNGDAKIDIGGLEKVKRKKVFLVSLEINIFLCYIKMTV